MKKTAYQIFGAVFCIMTLFLTGCQKQNEKRPDMENKETNMSSVNGAYAENLNVDIEELPDTQERIVKKIKLGNTDMDLEKLRECIFPEDTGVPTINSPAENVEQMATSQGLFLTKEDHLMNGNTQEWDQYNDFIGFAGTEEIMTALSLEEDLSFLTRAEAQEKAITAVKGIFPEFQTDGIQIYSFTKENLETVINNVKNNASYRDFIKPETFEREWTDEDEIYCIKISFKENGIPVLKEDVSLFDGSTIWGTWIEIWLNKRGIQSFQGVGLWKKEKEEETEICSLQEAVEALAGKYRNITGSSDVTVKEAELEYAPLTEGMNGERYLTPVWTLRGTTGSRMDSSDGEKGNMVMLTQEIHVNAETGRLIE